jgi:purine nucleosidase
LITAHKIILDIDTGIDDALAILLALNSPELELLGCSVVAGNTVVEQAVNNTLGVLQVAGRNDIPVARGAAHPLTRRLTTATHFHGPKGLGLVELPEPDVRPLELSGPQYLIEMSRRYAGELTVVATGPLTNLALALLLEPQWIYNLKRLIIMGGAVRCPGNITPVAEANFYNDPEAAQAVLSTGANITLVGLDVTTQARIAWSAISHHASQTEKLTPSAGLALELLRFYTNSHGESREAHLHDPLAVGIAAIPDLVKTTRMQVEVETIGRLTRGQSVGYSQTVIDQIENMGAYDDVVSVSIDHPFNAEVCLEVKASEFAELFQTRLGLGSRLH